MKIVLEHLTKKFPARGKKGEEVTAVRDFTFEIPDGSLIGLLGPSGCGKSTALNLLCGLEAPTEGKIYFGDTDVTDMPPELRGVGMVFQNYALYPHLTVRQNILFPLENLKGKAEAVQRRNEPAGRKSRWSWYRSRGSWTGSPSELVRRPAAAGSHRQGPGENAQRAPLRRASV